MAEFETTRFLTSGHVDDGKSTLIGRLLYDIGVVPDDQIEAARNKDGHIDYSLFTDGLEDERRQGITIDVAYRYFRHEGQRYRIADTPGHLQYMRNMAVAAIASDVAVILIDGIHGVRLQTVQYSKIAHFFGVRRFIVAINKMDAVDYSEARFNEIKASYLAEFGDAAKDAEITFIPVSALAGDNVTKPSENTPWYKGESLLAQLQQAPAHAVSNNDFRLPIQTVIKDGDVRWYLGTTHGDSVKVGDKLRNSDSGDIVTVTGLLHSGKKVEQANRREAIALSIAEDVDISRGSVLTRDSSPCIMAEGFYADVLWLDKKYEEKSSFDGLMKLHHREEQAQVSVQKRNGPLAESYVALAQPTPMDTFKNNPHTGLFILVDSMSERTIAVGTISQVIDLDSDVAI